MSCQTILGWVKWKISVAQKFGKFLSEGIVMYLVWSIASEKNRFNRKYCTKCKQGSQKQFNNSKYQDAILRLFLCLVPNLEIYKICIMQILYRYSTMRSTEICHLQTILKTVSWMLMRKTTKIFHLKVWTLSAFLILTPH